MSSDSRVCGTLELELLASLAHKKKYNRQVTSEFLDRLDPEGVHLLTLALAFHNEQQHHRIHGLAKRKDSMQPMEFWLDFDADKWDALPTAESFMSDSK